MRFLWRGDARSAKRRFVNKFHDVLRDSGLSEAIPRKGVALQWRPAQRE